jgi:hypothetical protein
MEKQQKISVGFLELPVEAFTVSNEVLIKKMGAGVWNLYYGSKKLTLIVEVPTKTAHTYVESISNKDRKENETTVLYAQVKKICQDLTEEIGEITYTLRTENKNMRLWAKSKGHDLFGWDEEGDIRGAEIESGRNLPFTIFRKRFENLG